MAEFIGHPSKARGWDAAHSHNIYKSRGPLLDVTASLSHFFSVYFLIKAKKYLRGDYAEMFSDCTVLEPRSFFASGQAMGGTLSALASIADLAIAKDVTDSALAYFLTADVFILICIITYLLLPKLEYSRHYMVAATSSSPAEMSEGGGAGSTIPPLQPILKKIWLLGLSVLYVFSISIMVFPAVSSGIQSVHKDSGSPWTTTYFVPLSCFLLYNVADLCGRMATAWLQVPGPTSKVLPALVLCRSVMVPLLMFCNYQPRDHLHTVVFAHDAYPVLFNCLLGLSNGYLGTLPMIYGPKVVHRELAEATGVVMSFFLTLGLTVGSAFSVLLVHYI